MEHVLFTCIEVSHRLIACPRAHSIDRVSRGCEHLLAEGGVQQGPPFGPPCFIRSGPFVRWLPAYTAHVPPRKPQGLLPGTPDCLDGLAQFRQRLVGLTASAVALRGVSRRKEQPTPPTRGAASQAQMPGQS